MDCIEMSAMACRKECACHKLSYIYDRFSLSFSQIINNHDDVFSKDFLRVLLLLLRDYIVSIEIMDCVPDRSKYIYCNKMVRGAFIQLLDIRPTGDRLRPPHTVRDFHKRMVMIFYECCYTAQIEEWCWKILVAMDYSVYIQHLLTRNNMEQIHFWNYVLYLSIIMDKILVFDTIVRLGCKIYNTTASKILTERIRCKALGPMTKRKFASSEYPIKLCIQYCSVRVLEVICKKYSINFNHEKICEDPCPVRTETKYQYSKDTYITRTIEQLERERQNETYFEYALDFYESPNSPKTLSKDLEEIIYKQENWVLMNDIGNENIRKFSLRTQVARFFLSIEGVFDTDDIISRIMKCVVLNFIYYYTWFPTLHEILAFCSPNVSSNMSVRSLLEIDTANRPPENGHRIHREEILTKIDYHYEVSYLRMFLRELRQTHYQTNLDCPIYVCDMDKVFSLALKYCKSSVI